MNEIQREITRIAALIYIERLKKWPEANDAERIKESIDAARKIVWESTDV